ncbi:MAG: MarR family winged helix-turn-helix transcriptional regulator [Treponema sp.]
MEEFMESDIGFIIKNINDKLDQNANKEFKAFELTSAQMRVVFFLQHQKNFETSQKALEDHLDVSHPTINGILKRMEEKGFVTSEITKKDGHLSKTVKATKKAQEIFKKAEKSKTVCEKRLSANLTEKEHAALIKLLLKVHKSVSEMQ